MSWSFSTTIKPEWGNNESIGLKIDRTNVGNQQCPRERDDQINAAIQAIRNLLVEGGFLYRAAEIDISISGHANKDHKKDDSWANEFISININVKSYKPEPSPAAPTAEGIESVNKDMTDTFNASLPK